GRGFASSRRSAQRAGARPGGSAPPAADRRLAGRAPLGQAARAVPRLNKKLLLAIEAVLDIAYNGGAAPGPASELSERQGTPRRYLEQVLQVLVREGILQGVRGPRGGYRLGRERRRISVGEIVRVLSRADSEEAEEAPAGTELGRRVLRPLWRDL